MISREKFEALGKDLFRGLSKDETLTANLIAENTQFMRLNRSKVRQIGTVEDALLELRIQRGAVEASGTVTLTGDARTDLDRAQTEVQRLQSEARELPENPYLAKPGNHGTSEIKRRGKILSPEEAASALLPEMKDLWLTGIYASGTMIRGNLNSLGQNHWFETDQFSLDYSLEPKERVGDADHAVKGEFAGADWNQSEYQKELARAREQAHALCRPVRKIERGKYRAYLAPAAVGELIGMFSWGTLSEAAIRQGDSALVKVRKGEAHFSPRFGLSEDFRSGEVPRFNDEGELAPEVLPLIQGGRLLNTLVSQTSANEYGVKSNGAGRGESLRSPSVLPGGLAEGQELAKLGTGLYLSNLHYLNWSDQQAGRVTGMTRYACFWVEDGKLVAPIQNLRWDDTIFNLLGSQLEDLGTRARVLPNTGTYNYRQLGAMRVPGALIQEMSFTL